MHCTAFIQDITPATSSMLNSMALEWDVLIVEMVMLGAIIYGAVFVENWVEKRKLRRKEKEDAIRTIEFVANDLRKKLRFIEDSVQYKDFKPFFRHVGCRHTGRQTNGPPFWAV